MGEVLKINGQLVKKNPPLIQKLTRKLYDILFEKKLFLFLVALLLGRAVILFETAPFIIAFLAALWASKIERLFTIVMFMLIGAWSYSVTHGLYITLSIAVFTLFASFIKNRSQMKGLIVFVFVAPFVTRLFLYSLNGQLTIYEWLHLFVEGILAVILLLIFMQTIPLLSLHKYRPKWKNEELICIVILLASVLTGFIGWEVYEVGFEHIFSRYFVLIFAFVGGAAVGSTVGVVAGLILSLANVANIYQMSLLAFSGLLGGLLIEGKKIGVSVGLLVGSFFIGLYSDATSLMPALFESTLAIILFLLTPQSWLTNLAKLVPGTEEYSSEERKYLQKMRDITAKKVERFSEVFAALSNSFMTEEQKKREEQVETDYFLSEITEKTCNMCVMKKRCWQNQFDETYDMMEQMKTELMDYNEISPPTLKSFRNYCLKANKVLDVMMDEITILKMNKQIKKQVTESKKIVADQLKGVSDVMNHFAKEIVKERQRHEKQEIQIVRALKQMAIPIENIEIFNLEKGNVDIELTVVLPTYHGEGAKLIAPVLSDILQETIVVAKEDVSRVPYTPIVLVFQSAKLYEVETGVAIAAKGGGLISGDSYAFIEFEKGKFALAISDGMGNGVRAREESMETLRLLKQILQTGISEQVAIKSINSILALRTTDEIFATLDLAIINLHNASAEILKIGSSPSFIKRKNEIIQLEANNIPMGIVEFVELETVEKQLHPGDLLVLMSDGVYEGAKHIINKDMWLKRKLAQIRTNEPQAIADIILEEVIRSNHGNIHDDMTVIVAKIKKTTPEWATIRTYTANV